MCDESAPALAAKRVPRWCYGAKGFFTKPRQSLQNWRGLSLAEAPWRGIQRSPDGSPLEHGRVPRGARYCDRSNRLVAKVESQAMFRWGHVVSGTSLWPLCPRAHTRSSWIKSCPLIPRDVLGHGHVRSAASRFERREDHPSTLKRTHGDPEARIFLDRSVRRTPPRRRASTPTGVGRFCRMHSRWLRRYPALTGWVASW